MTEPLKRRGRGWKILGVVVGVILLFVAALFLWVSAVAGRKFDEMEARSKSMIAERRARSATRPVLRGRAEAGNAWDDYTPCLDEIKKTKDITKLGLLVTRDPKGDPEFGRQMLATHAKALELMRQGAGRGTAQFPYEWERGANMNSPGLLLTQNAGNLAVLQARALAESGKPQEAAAQLLDLLQFGRDVGDGGVLITEMISIAVMGLALNEAKDLIQAGKFDAASLRDLDAGLVVLDGSFPNHGQTMIDESIASGAMLRDMGAATNTGFSRLMYANAFERCVEWYGAAAKADPLPWLEAQKQFSVLERECKSSWNPMARLLLPGFVGISKPGRQRRAQLRMLRTVIRFKSTGELLELDDPFGTKLKTSQSAEALKIWSVGFDGADDGGAGTWQGGNDYVLDLKK